MVKYISDRIGVMHWGKMLEIGTSDDVYNHPIHPYTKSLLSAIPEPDPDKERQRVADVYDQVKNWTAKNVRCMRLRQAILS